jgi:hypothetical protein
MCNSFRFQIKIRFSAFLYKKENCQLYQTLGIVICSTKSSVAVMQKIRQNSDKPALKQQKSVYRKTCRFFAKA